MYIIAGLGNPGKEYEKTRHNAGFGVIDVLAADAGISAFGKEHRALVGKGTIAGEKCLLVKPQTYMNLSGESIREIMDYYRVEEENLIVISDDVAQPVGQIRVRPKGSAGGHNGLKNIIQHLGNDNFVRVRVGVGAPVSGGGSDGEAHQKMISHVLGRVTGEDGRLLEEATERAAEAVRCILSRGVDTAMNQYNTRKKAEGEES